MMNEDLNCPHLAHDGYEWRDVMNALTKDAEFRNGVNDC
jgi:hypothetical protein